VTTILVLNVGSSSVKYQLFSMPDETVLAKGHRDRIGGEGGDFATHGEALASIVSDLPVDYPIDVVGHRIVHGGEAFTTPVVITDEVVKHLTDVSALAPLHTPPNLAGIEAAMAALPAAIQVAVFDTAFFAHLPPEASTYAIPAVWRDAYGIKKYGFHGTSHEYISGELSAAAATPPRRVISCHLGNGSSMAAIVDGVAVDTSLGFTPLPGLVMGTRSGDIDPAIIFHLQRAGMSPDEVEQALTREGGLLGLTGSSDMRDIVARADQGDAQCELALSVWAGRIRHYVGAYWATMGGVDAMVFTGGIGENSAVLRSRVLALLQPLGFRVDESANKQATGAAGIISAEHSSVEVWVIPTDEEKQIARHSHHLVSAGR
jgi:acetate kinase